MMIQWLYATLLFTVRDLTIDINQALRELRSGPIMQASPDDGEDREEGVDAKDVSDEDQD